MPGDPASIPERPCWFELRALAGAVEAFGASSLPEPDVAVVRGSPRDYAKRQPQAAELVVEVSDSSLDIDRGRKLRLYAREGVPEYWIVNLADDCVEVRRQPVGENYAESRAYRRGESIVTGPHGRLVAVNDLLP